ncbi:glycerophosphocholine acyltransferase 1-like isoform X2 [Dioscorea cayenensis subsp. rotundata]|uniref:Glycerophosphocholine acyltransferase 1 n=1 Tax=Dioscorea cayennensis subsp. rotundata TaxID=55577 RepID=A0AB40B2V2_DIOCR|nr:glycerophosphocholine acyltransferase 1-like isoform X2 [Dioscorea cayenensis subsp. rotundata]
MAEEGQTLDDTETFRRVRQRIAEKSKRVVETKDKTKEILSKQAIKIAKQAEEHERFITKVTHLLGVLGFGAFCFILGARPQDVPYVYCVFYVTFVPLRWIYYRCKKWHYYLLGPLAWALIVWRCSLVFSSADKIVSVLIHLLPGIVFFTIRWWNPGTLAAMHPVGKAKSSWPYVEGKSYLSTWLFVVPLVAYTLWQLLYFLVVNVLRRQRLLRDPEVMTSYRELSKKAQKANNVWWRLSGLLGEQNRQMMYILLQAVFTVATMALTVPIFLCYEMHVIFQILKVSAAIWNGGNFLLEVMPRQVVLKEKMKLEIQPLTILEQPLEQQFLAPDIIQASGE